MSPLIYLASPYWHENEIIRLARANMVKIKTAELLSLGHKVYSPIAHNHDLARHLPPVLRHSHDFWMSVDLTILRRCDELWVLQLQDWQLSRGVACEIQEAQECKLTVRYIDYAPANKPDSNILKQAEKDLRSGTATNARGFD